MTIYIVETTARASIREFWRVEADSEEAAREAIGDVGTPAEFLFDETLGDGDGREVDTVHPGDMLDGQLERRKVEAAAPAMLAALEAGEGYLANHADKGDRAAQGLAAMVRAAIAQARGAPTEATGHPIADAQQGEA